ncbi:MAG: glycosyltransferase family 2 protein [Nitrosarchaeum sp.]
MEFPDITQTTPSSDGLVSIIIPLYNGQKHLLELMQSLKNQTYNKIEVIVVDNNSTDDSVKLLKSLNEKIIHLNIFLNKKNEGYCGGCNEGIKHASGEYFLFLSQDRIMNNDWIEKIVKMMNQDEKIGCIVGKVIRDGASSPEYGHSYDVFGAVLINGTPDESKLFFGGGTVLIRKKTIDQVGGFDPEFFIYQEDVDICWRIRLAGYHIKIEKNAVCQNRGGGISDTFYDNRKYNISFDSELINMPLYKFYYSQRNRIRTLLKNYSFVNVLKRLPAVIILILLRGIFMSISTRKGSYFLAVFRGFWWNITHAVNTMKIRKKIQHYRVINDDEIEKYMLPKSIEFNAMMSLRRGFTKRSETSN